MPAPKGNKYAIGNTGGRPPMFKDAKDLDKKIQAYFDSLLPTGEDSEQESGNPTITGLALFLGFSDKSSLYDYKRHDNEEFSHSIKRALLVIESHYEARLNYQAPTGAIFALKNMSWSDKTELEHSGEVTVPAFTWGTKAE